MGGKLQFTLGLVVGLVYGALCLLIPRLNRALERRWEKILLSHAAN